MSESHILWKEVLPNAMLPLITLLDYPLATFWAVRQLLK